MYLARQTYRIQLLVGNFPHLPQTRTEQFLSACAPSSQDEGLARVTKYTHGTCIKGLMGHRNMQPQTGGVLPSFVVAHVP